jgi:hypothetical protein
LLQGGQAVGHLKTRKTQAGLTLGRQATLGQAGNRTCRLGLGQEVMGVEAFAAQGDEAVAGLEAAGVAVQALPCWPPRG